MQRRSCIESLETRLFLAAQLVPLRTIDGEAVTEFAWKGENVQAFAGRWILKLDGYGGYLLDQQAQARQRIETPGSQFKVLRHLGVDGVFLVQGPLQMNPTDVVASLSAAQGYRFVEPDFRYALDLTPNDSSYSQMWGLNNTGQFGGTVGVDINAPQAWDFNTGSSNIVVGMIDSGIDYNHPDLANNIYINPLEIPGNFIDDDLNGYTDDVRGYDFYGDNPGGGSPDADPMDQSDHGTHTAGTVGAVGNNGTGITGVSWNVKLIPLKIGGAAPSVSAAAGISAMAYCAAMKSRPTSPPDIRAVNCSWGGPGFSGTMSAAVSALGSNDIMLVAAAGNQGTNNDSAPHYPSSYTQDNVIAVANLTNTNQRSPDSNYGPTSVDLAAPGNDILSTIRVTSGSYAFFGGTSMASPHVAGAVALLASASPTSTYQTLRNAIFNTVTPVAAFSGLVVTGGRLNLEAAIASLAAPAAPATPDLTTGSDTGISNSDNITRDNTPTFQGTATQGRTIRIFADGVQVAQVVVPPSGLYQATTSALTDGLRAMTATQSVGAGGTQSAHSAPLNVRIDTVAPVPAGTFNYLTSPHSYTVNFGEDVAGTNSDVDYLVENLTNPGVVAHTGSHAANSSTLSFTSFAVLPEASFRVTVHSSLADGGNGISDVAGNELAAETFLNFKFLIGDANNDGLVNLTDYNMLAANYNQSPRNFAQGDFNYDTLVNLADYNLLASRYGTSVGPDGSASPGVGATRAPKAPALPQVRASLFGTSAIGARSKPATNPFEDLTRLV